MVNIPSKSKPLPTPNEVNIRKSWTKLELLDSLQQGIFSSREG